MSLPFSKYILQFSKNTENEQTHLSFKNGKYNIPDNYADVFYKRYYQEMTNKEKRNDLYLIEKVYNTNFAYFLDLEIPKNESNNLKKIVDDDVKEIIIKTKTVLESLFVNPKTEYVVSKRNDNYHINFYNIIVNSAIAKTITNEILKTISINCIDTSVYRTGLRLLGSKKYNKSVKESFEQVYKIYNIDNKEFKELENTTFEEFLQTTVRRKTIIELSKLKESEKTKELIKNNETRKNIKDDFSKLKRLNILDIKNYLRKHNLIKVGSNAPNDVLRQIYENSVLSGKITNLSNENLMHNFLSDK